VLVVVAARAEVVDELTEVDGRVVVLVDDGLLLPHAAMTTAKTGTTDLAMWRVTTVMQRMYV
jgi:hypothetical protein